MTSSIPTRGQVERTLAQRIQALYREKLGHRLEKVTCQFFDEKLAIILENSTTHAEQLLLGTEQGELAVKLRWQIDMAIRPQVKAMIEEIAGVSVIALLSDTAIESGFSGFLAILNGSPPVRDPASIPKIRKEKVVEIDS
ncbi:MAG: DUF2294 domain-containing protein [Leptolyngbyaceae cyanobacterium RM2_2_4]|nr:DUF2294 domain-containing protein [Leptolyngbyaceae cyanobacterium SM1_4_3]NJN91931.1 DUF2294 domain-containing protein [Leptolyngbyaceae cyanobacterium SL_5_14]NJO48568.1 DUF2294 domain-containing protein [Leptolyngbyaceae cyanobacterium RM2_2_4]